MTHQQALNKRKAIDTDFVRDMVKAHIEKVRAAKEAELENAPSENKPELEAFLRGLMPAQSVFTQALEKVVYGDAIYQMERAKNEASAELDEQLNLKQGRAPNIEKSEVGKPARGTLDLTIRLEHAGAQVSKHLADAGQLISDDPELSQKVQVQLIKEIYRDLSAATLRNPLAVADSLHSVDERDEPRVPHAGKLLNSRQSVEKAKTQMVSKRVAETVKSMLQKGEVTEQVKNQVTAVITEALEEAVYGHGGAVEATMDTGKGGDSWQKQLQVGPIGLERRLEAARAKAEEGFKEIPLEPSLLEQIYTFAAREVKRDAEKELAENRSARPGH